MAALTFQMEATLDGWEAGENLDLEVIERTDSRRKDVRKSVDQNVYCLYSKRTMN